MKLSKLYSNKPEVFPDIIFKDGMNVIYAKVTRPEDKKEDSHNLGKTLLIHLLDFMLLKGKSTDHFLYAHGDRFESFTFYLEVALNNGRYITIKREMTQPSKIWIHTHVGSQQDLTTLAVDEWTHQKLGSKKGKEKLNDLLHLSMLSPWHYRKGVGYFLRTQSDYEDVFELARFSSGRHKDWKPFLAKLLGFDYSLFVRKYELDDQKEKLSQNREASKELTTVETAEYDNVKGTLEIKREEMKDASAEVERFNFYESDLELNSELLEHLEKEISSLNELRYTNGFELQKVDESIQTKTTFDINKVSQLFEEAGTAFPNAIKRSYEELIGFNKRISSDRSKRLIEQRQRLQTEQKLINQRLVDLNRRREELLAVLQDTDTLNKYRRLQRNLTELETTITKLEMELEQLDRVSGIDREIQRIEERRDETVESIREAVRNGNERYKRIRKEFNRIVKRILGVPAVLSISINREGNPEFKAKLLRSEKQLIATSQDKGNSYRQLLCSAFDLALLSEYSEESFFHFVYHDGILESLDDRKKLELLAVVRELCATKGIQYIMTLIDADMPRDAKDKRIPFADDEIIRQLHDGSDDGRLFRMEKF